VAKKKKYVVVQDGMQTRLTQKALSRRIRMEWYDGHELFRLVHEPESALRPLHTHELYQTIHQLTPEEAAGHVQLNTARGFAWHAAVFLGVMIFLGNPSWGIFWLIALLAHGAKSLGALQKVFADGLPKGIARLSGSEKLALPTLAPTPTGADEPEDDESPRDELEQQLADEWARLDDLGEKLDAEGKAHVESSRDSLDEILDHRAQVREHLAGEDADALDAEAAELEAEAAAAPDTRTREVLEQAIAAIAARRAAVTELAAANVRLTARARATLHQLKSIRMSLVSAGPEESGRTALGTLTDELREEARSAAELEEALAGGRVDGAQVAAGAARSGRKEST